MKHSTSLPLLDHVHASGARLLLEPNRALPLVNVLVALKSGAAEDPAELEGLARFVSRMMRRTAGGMSAEVIDSELDTMGGALGAEVGQSSIMFHGAVISRSLEPFIELLAKVLTHPAFGSDEVERLRRETESEIIQGRDDDRTIARRAFRRACLPDHPYCRSAAGTLSSVGAFTSEQIKTAYRRHLTAGNLVLVMAGDVTEGAARGALERIVQRLPSLPAVPDSVSEPNWPSGRRLVFVDKPARSQSQIFIGGSGTHPRDEDHFALLVANTAFGGTFTARMTQEIRAKRGWSYGAYSSLGVDRHRLPFAMWTFPKSSDAAACIGLQLEMLEELCSKGITKRELAWVQRYLVRSHAFAVDTAAKRVGLVAERIVYDLPEGYYDDYLASIRAVTLERANHALATRLSPDNLLLAVLGTHDDIGEQVCRAIPGLQGQEVWAFDADF